MMATVTTSGHSKIFKDPVLGQVALSPLLVAIVDTVQFQRLRDIKQLGPVYHVYPGASHNRFEHSIGVCHLARQMLKHLRREQESFFKTHRIEKKDDTCVLIAALCHELGQGPMSHLYQDLFMPSFMPPGKKWKHIETCIKMFDYMVQQNLAKLQKHFADNDIDPDPNSADMIFIKELIYGGILPCNKELKGRPKPEHWFLYEIVSNAASGVDVDKMDYIIRDCHGLGIQHYFDWQRYIRFSRLIRPENDKHGRTHICSREKEAADLYELFHVRNKLFKEAYQHKTKRSIEHMMAEALRKANPYLTFSGHEGKKVKMSEAIDDMCAFTRLSDGVFYLIKNSEDEQLKQARHLLERVESRDLYQCVGKSLPNEKQLAHSEEDIANELIKALKEQTDNVPEFAEMDIPTPDDILVDIVTFNYGKSLKEEDQNPINEVWFFRKFALDTAVRIQKSQVSKMLPERFVEFELRLYLKVKVPDKLKEQLYSVFDQYCVANGYENPAGASPRD